MQHQQLSAGRWHELSFMEQMANIGSEVERMIRWRAKNQPKFVNHALVRAMELIDLTVQQHVDQGSTLKELMRVKECLIDDFVYDNQYHSTDLSWQKYFRAFNYAARVNR